MAHSTCIKCGAAILNDFSKDGTWFFLDEQSRAWKCTDGKEHEPQLASGGWKGRFVDAFSVAGKIAFYIQLLIFAGLTGAIERHWQSPYAWVEYRKVLHSSGTANAVPVALLYLLYYGFFVEVSGLVLWRLLVRGTPSEKGSIQRLAVCSCWVLFTFLLFAGSIFQFLRSVPVEAMNGWLVIGWLASTVVAGLSFWRLVDARLREYRQSSSGYRYEQFLDRHGLLGQFFEEEVQRKKDTPI